MADIGTLNPEQMLQQQQILRQQKMAEMLLQQGMQQPQGQMVSGRYVAPSIFQNIAGLANTYMGQRGIERAEKAQLDMAKAIRQGDIAATADFMSTRQGRPAEMFPAQAGPMPDGGNIPIQESRAGIAPNPQAAFANLAVDPRASARLQNIGLNKMFADPESFTLNEGAIRFEKQADGTTKQVAAGGQKPRAPLQIDTGTAIELRDPNNPTIVLQSIPKSQMPTAGQVVERDDGTFLVDTRTGQARPVMGQGGQPLMGGGKPLTESQGNSVAFGARAIEANRIVTELEKAGTTNTGIVRSAIGGTVGMAPFVGGKMEQAVQSTMNIFPSFAGGPNEMQQQTDQGRRNFISAVLRKESGAAIPVDEYANEEKKYFPQVGDGPKVIKQKQEARNLAIESLKAQAGPSGIRQINQITGQAQSGNTGNVVEFNSLPKGR